MALARTGSGGKPRGDKLGVRVRRDASGYIWEQMAGLRDAAFDFVDLPFGGQLPIPRKKEERDELISRLETWVFHYTDKAGYDAICASGYIRASDIKQGAAFYGKGVYVTQLPPTLPFFKILYNNYAKDGGTDGTAGVKNRTHHADYVFAYKVIGKDLANVGEDGRSIFKMGGGENVSLSNRADGKPVAIRHGPVERWLSGFKTTQKR